MKTHESTTFGIGYLRLVSRFTRIHQRSINGSKLWKRSNCYIQIHSIHFSYEWLKDIRIKLILYKISPIFSYNNAFYQVILADDLKSSHSETNSSWQITKVKKWVCSLLRWVTILVTCGTACNFKCGWERKQRLINNHDHHEHVWS